MADDTREKVVNEAEKFSPAQEETSRSISLSQDLWKEMPSISSKLRPQEKSGPGDDPFSFHQGGDKGTKDNPANPNRDPFDYHQGPRTDGTNAAGDLQKLFDKARNTTAGDAKSESYEQGQGVLRVLDKNTAQYVDASGKTTTRINENTCIEYDPKTQQYTRIGKDGTRQQIKDENEKVDPKDANSKTLKELKEKGISTESVKESGSDGQKTTYLDGRVTTVFKDGRLAERTTYPPGQTDGLRQVEKVRELPPGDKTETSARTVKTYEDRKETTFDKGDISKITATRNPDQNHPAVIMEYRDNKGPKKPNDPNGPGASRVETYKDDGNPNHLKQIAQYRDGSGNQLKPDQITFNNGQTVERAPNGDIRTPVGKGEHTGVLDVGKDSGMPTHMQIGDRDYKVTYGKDGKADSMTVEAKGNPPGKLELKRNDKGELEVKSADGRFKPDANGKIDLDGLPVQTKDGKVVGDVHLNKNGDLRYKDSDGPERHEIIRRADGSKEDYDYKNWKRTLTSADGKTSKDQYWDGFEWRGGKTSADGKRVEFSPPDPNKPSFIERSTGGNPPQDMTTVGYADGSQVKCDWKNQTQTEISRDGKQTTRYYDGSTYREIDGQPARNANGDTQVKFKEPVKDDQPSTVTRHQDGSMTIEYKNSTKVEKNAHGQVTEVNRPDGKWKFDRDGDGDIKKVTEYGPDGKEKNSYTRVGQEKDPGMEQWLNREGNGAPRRPSDTPPRDPNKPQEYNNWVDKDGKPINGLNIHTTADGTIRMESAPGQGREGQLKVIPPAGDSYRDTPTQRITDKPGGITETIDKTQNPPVGNLEFNRNGQKFNISSKDGPYQVAPDGTVTQMSKDGKQIVKIMPDGSTAKFDNKFDPGKPNVPPQQTLSELKIAKPNADSSKPGDYQTITVPPAKSMEALQPQESNRFKVVTTDGGKDTATTYDLIKGTKAQQRPGENFLRETSLKDGKPVGLRAPDGTQILKFNADGTATGAGDRKYDPRDWNVKPEDVKVGPGGDPVITGTNGKDTALFKASGAVVETKDGKEKTIFPNKVEATFDDNKKLKSLTIAGKEYEPVLNGDGKVTALKPKGGGVPIESVPKGTAYTLNDNGQLVCDMTDDKTKTQTHKEWNPDKGTATVQRTWTSSGGDQLSLGLVTDASGKVSKFQMPGRDWVDVAGAQARMPKLEAKFENEKLNIKFDDKKSIVVNEDGSSDYTIKGALGGKDIVNHRDRNLDLVAAGDQAEAISKLVSEDALKDQSKQQELANSLLNRFLYLNDSSVARDVQTYLKSLNEGVLKSMGVNIVLNAGNAPGKYNVVVTRNGKATTIAWSRPTN